MFGKIGKFYLVKKLSDVNVQKFALVLQYTYIKTSILFEVAPLGYYDLNVPIVRFIQTY